MKQDLNQLKNMFFQMVQANDLEMPPVMDNVNATVSMIPNSNVIHGSGQNWNINNSTRGNESQLDRPMILPKQKEEFETVELIEEHLSLDEMEKDMINKALKKFNGKRKDAADELGISERTLYRKIKQFSIDI